jgi:hypothetical protein
VVAFTVLCEDREDQRPRSRVTEVIAHTDDRTTVYRADRVLEAVVLQQESHRPDGFDLVAFWQQWSADFESSRQQLTVTVKIHPDLWDTLPEVFGEAVIPRMDLAPTPGDDG